MRDSDREEYSAVNSFSFLMSSFFALLGMDCLEHFEYQFYVAFLRHSTQKFTEELYQQDASNKKGSIPKNFSSFPRRPVVYVCAARRRRHEQSPDSPV